ncbi:MAG: glycosyltransferase [Fimbriimonadales bacterium]|nr:glycosyltransferase [Fimbriimonadales bacterium]
MRLLHVIASARLEHGGPIEGVRQRARVLRELGHEPEIACLDDPADVRPDQFPCPVHALGPAKGSYQWCPAALEWLRANVRRFDAVTVHGLWQHHGVLCRKAALEAEVPYFVFPHGMLDPWFNRAYPLKALKKRLYWPIEHRVLRDAKAVLFTCEEERLLARKSFRPYRVRERVVRYGTAEPEGDPDEQRAAFARAFPQLAERPFLLFLSRIHPKKGCALLLRAFAESYPAEDPTALAMAGPDQVGWRGELERLARTLGLQERVVWTDMLTGDAKWGAFRGCEAFVLPSHQENFGIAVAEAMACGRPVLITRRVNIWREVEQDGAGLVDEDTPQGIAALLRRWRSVPSAERLRMGERARECFLNRFEIRAATLDFLAAVSS